MNHKPYIVLALSGTSSPFEHAAELKMAVRQEAALRGLQVVDISGFHTDYFFDLLGLLEGAHCLVAIDSGVLHLAAALPALPVVALVTREPSGWHGSAWRPQHVARFFYDEFPERIEECVAAAVHAREHFHQPRIWHTWSQPDRELTADASRRMAFAQKTWEEEHPDRWRRVPFRFDNQWRDSGEAPIGDPRPMPFMRDLVEHVLTHEPRAHDIIALTNADVCFAPGLTGWILDRVPRCGACFTHRWDFQPSTFNLKLSEAAVQRGAWYPGSDAFFFTVEWWRAHEEEFPDMIYGREQCDEVLRQLIKRHGGLEIPAAIYHEKHASFWEQPGVRETNPGNVHNRRLARKWFLRTGSAPLDPFWHRIPEGEHTDPVTTFALALHNNKNISAA